MSETNRCPKCGLQLAANSPHGLCPGCLFRGALESQPPLTGTYFSVDGDVNTPLALDYVADRFPGLEILRFIGRGGMGMVYLARQKQLDRKVALKILSPKIAGNPAFAERFAREARLMALLNHPHVVTVFEFGTTPATESEPPLYYLLMEFVDGATLRQLLNEGQLGTEQAFAIVPQICEALQYAHDKGVVHRDIKPENILLDRAGKVKIADFGLAKLMGLQPHDLTLSTTGQILGTLNYMAPEQMERPLEVDHRADIYSLGVVFYQMLTGELPLGRFAPPSQKASIDVRLDEVVLRALEKDRDRRYQQASAMQSQVETIATTSSGLSTPSPDLKETQVRGAGRTRLAMLDKFWIARGIAVLFGGVGLIGFLGILAFTVMTRFAPTTLSSIDALANSPPELRRASKERVILAGLANPLSPWAWQELERRTITAEDANSIVEQLTQWVEREHDQGPIPWLNQFLERLDKFGLVSQERKIDFAAALQGGLRMAPSVRLREPTERLTINVELRSVWNHQIFGLKFVNELQSMTLDGEPLSIDNNKFGTNWDAAMIYREVPIPTLKPGKHKVQANVLSALIADDDLVGLPGDARSEEWPQAKKRWVRTVDAELTVYAADAQIVGMTEDPAMNPLHHGLTLDPVVIRQGNNGQSRVVLNFKYEQALLVPISFDVSVQFGDQRVPISSMWAARTSKGFSRGGDTMTTLTDSIDESLTHVDVVLTPNPKWIELQSEVDQIWGTELILRKIALRRLAADPSTSREN
jgi:serine/threonine protein kinase